MKISHQTARERGFATVAVLAILSIMLIFVTANTRRLQTLDRELKLIEQRQIGRAPHIAATPPGAHSPPATHVAHGPD